jgi:hypothetical protein
MRLDQLWKNCHSFKRNGKFSQWNDELDTIWLELARDIGEKDYYDLDKESNKTKDKDKIITNGYKSKFDEFDKELGKLMPFEDSGNIGFIPPDKSSKEKRNEQYQILMRKQLFLARLENELDKGTTYEEEDDDF